MVSLCGRGFDSLQLHFYEKRVCHELMAHPLFRFFIVFIHRITQSLRNILVPRIITQGIFTDLTLHFERHQPQNINILQAKLDIKEHKDNTSIYSIDILSHIKQNHFQSERIKHPIAYKSKELIKQLIKIDYFFFVFRQNVVPLQS